MIGNYTVETVEQQDLARLVKCGPIDLKLVAPTFGNDLVVRRLYADWHDRNGLVCVCCQRAHVFGQHLIVGSILEISWQQ